MQNEIKRVGVIGAGSWGSALAIASSRAYPVTLWTHREEQAQYINYCRSNPKYLPAEILMPENILVTGEFNELSSCDLLIVSTPLNAVREILERLKILFDDINEVPDLFLVSKGFEAGSGKLPHEIVNDVLPNFSRFGLLIGPSFAKEVAIGLPTAITLASSDSTFATKWMHQLNGIPNFRIYAHDDVIGSEVGSAIKNVLAIAVGISDGLSLGYNARAALITRSLNELSALVLALGGKKETIYGLTGIGDLILTCTGDLSRNRKVGQELALGKTIDEVVTSLGHVAEGVSTAREIYLKAQQLKIDMPISNCVYNIIYNKADIHKEVSNLLSRAPKVEFV